MGGKNIHPYYRDRILDIADEMVSNMTLERAQFEVLIPNARFDEVVRLATDELMAVLPYLPYAGGDEGRMTPFFRLGAGTIAVGRALRGLGASSDTIATLMRKTFLAKIAALPEAERLELGRQWLSQENQAYLQEQAGVSRRQDNPGDFVYTFVASELEGSTKPFDFGIDYTECGFCKMCNASGDVDLLPHICAMDKESYGMRGIDLQRTTTLASGADRCNFRFKAKE